MATRVTCKCGKVLTISAELLGRRLRCTSCGNVFIAKAKSTQPGEDSRSKEPPAEPAIDSPKIELEPANLDHLLVNNEPANPTPVALDLTLKPDGAALPAIPVESAPEVHVEYATDRPTGGPGRRYDAVSGPQRTFWEDAWMSFGYPVFSVGNTINFAIIAIVGCLPLLFFFIPVCIRIPLSLIIFGWLAALFLNVVSETARGSDDLPSFAIENGTVDGVIRPAIYFLGAFAIVIGPAVALSILNAVVGLPDIFQQLWWVWFATGLFFFPMSLMLFAFESPGTFFRIDLILATVALTILPYLSIWGLLLIVGFLRVVMNVGAFSMLPLPSYMRINVFSMLAMSTIGQAILTSINLYLTIVAMRFIGLYYRHFKKRFAFKME